MIKLPRRMGTLVAATTAGAAALAVSGVAVAGAVSGTGTKTPRQATTSLAYACRFTSGTQRVGVRIAAKFLAAGTVGQAIQPAGVHVTITVPRAALGDLTRLGAATVRASATLEVTVAEGGTSASTAWRVAPTRPASLPATGSLVLAASGAVPAATATAPGAVTFTAEGLYLVLTPQRAAGTATSPAALPVACDLPPGQDPRLAAVPVSGPSPSPAVSGRADAGRHPPIAVGRSPRGSGSRATTSCFTRSIGPFTIGSAFLSGFSDVNKLHGAVRVGPGPDNNPRAALSGLLTQELLVNTCTGNNYFFDLGKLIYHGRSQFPPAVSTLLAFRFMPVTATLIITLVPMDCRDLTGFLVGRTDLCIQVENFAPTYTKYTTTSTSEMVIRVSNLAVNGVRLNVGSRCQTVQPTKTVLSGNYNILNGGALSGYVTVPFFTRCGVGENLDPLLNASVSGPRNFAIITQGPLCQKALPQGNANSNCKIKPGTRGYPYGLPKFYPKPVR